MKHIKDWFYRFFEILFHFQNVTPNKVYFSSFRGQYNDNPKYISIKLHELHPEIKQYWLISEKSKMNDIPQYVTILKYYSLKHYWYKNQCIAIVENGAGNYVLNTSKQLRSIKTLLKNKKQFDLSTWHGNPIKHIGAQIPGNESWTKETFFSTSDILIAGCERIKSIFEEAFLGVIPIILSGTPRNDILFSNDIALKETIRNKLGLPLDKKILLYAPTYRNSTSDSGLIQIESIDFERLFNSLSIRFGGEWVFVFRVHNLVVQAINTKVITDKFNERIIDGNRFDDMAEYLYSCDILLTDYSGCIYDVTLTQKPCFLFAHDKEYYISVERGLYTPLEQFPYSFSNTFDELILNILNYDSDLVEKRRVEFLKFIGNVEDGHASERAVRIIEDYILNPNNKKV